MSTDLRVPGRTIGLDRLKPGDCYLAPGPDGPDLALVVTREGRRATLLLNRRIDVSGHLPIVSGLATGGDVLALRGAILAPSGAIGDIAVSRAAMDPAALHLGDGRAYLCGCDEAGRIATFDVASGVARVIDPADLPHARRWRVIVPKAGGVVTVYESAPD